MSDKKPSDKQPADVQPPEPANLQDLMVDLNFVPNWARKDSNDTPVYEERPQREGRGGGNRDRSRTPHRDGARPAGGGRPNLSQRGGGKAPRGDQRDRSGGQSRDDRRGGGHDRGADRRGHHGHREERIQLPIEISFIPDRDRLGAVVRQLHAVKRAFPLPYLAGLFLSKPEYHMLKLEARPAAGTEPIQFFQCKETRAVFLTREELISYLTRHFLDRYFDRVEVTMEPPSGNFVCVGRCKRTGTLLGPPNYHGYNEKLMDVHRTHFSNQSLDQYRNQIEMVREPEVIEKWKESCRTQIKYRPKDTPEAEASLTMMEAEFQFIEKYAASFILSGTKVILPASAIAHMSDEKLRSVLQGAWMREDRFPLSLILALRPAFRRMRLHLFKAGKDDTFVTAIPPKPFDAEHAIPEIKDMVTLISAHPGWNRKQLVDKLYPGKSLDDPEVVEKMSPISWLIDKGHIIEFFNGTYAVPGHLKAPGVAPSEKPQEHHHPETLAENLPAAPAPVENETSESTVPAETSANEIAPQ